MAGRVLGPATCAAQHRLLERDGRAVRIACRAHPLTGETWVAGEGALLVAAAAIVEKGAAEKALEVSLKALVVEAADTTVAAVVAVAAEVRP